MFIIKHRKIFITISIILTVISITLIAAYGLKPGIDFKGGAQTEVTYTGARPEVTELQNSVAKLNIGEAVIQPVGEIEYVVKTRDLTEAEHQAILKAVSVDGKYESAEKSYTSIGPSIGQELAKKAITSIILVLTGIIFFMAYAFRKVSRPVSSWKYGLITIVTLIHNIIIPVGLFALMGHLIGAEIDTLFVVALLTILGLSVHDTIVVFDRIRENLRTHSSTDFAQTVGLSTSQTFTRSVNTALTIIMTLLALYIFGPETTKNFALVLTVGMFFGIYSSIFLASPLLVVVERMQSKNKKKK